MPLLVEFAIALPVVLLVAYFIALVLRRLFGAARSLSLALMTVIAVVGVSIGLLLTAWLLGETRLWVRIGNSRRALGVDEAVDYVARHWRRSLGSVLLGRPLG